MASPQKILRLLDGIEDIAVDHIRAVAGPLTLSVGFASRELRREVSGSFLSAPDAAAPQAKLIIASQRELDLSALLAAEPEKYAFSISDDAYVLWLGGSPNLLYATDMRRGVCLAWSSAPIPPPWDVSRPGLPCLFGLMADTAWLPMHAAAVGKDDRFLLIAGAAGIGKSTTALACAMSGWSYAGDDFVAARSSPAAEVLPLYASARLRMDLVSRFPAAFTRSGKTTPGNDPDPRLELQLAAALPDLTIAGGRLSAILLPRRRGALRPEITPARRVDAMQAIFSTNVAMNPGWRKRISDRLIALTGSVPVYFIDTGNSIEAIPEALGALLDRL